MLRIIAVNGMKKRERERSERKRDARDRKDSLIYMSEARTNMVVFSKR